MTFLLDVNVLIALSWPNHVHHQRAREWFELERDGFWATCPLTQSAFVRISANPVIVKEAVTPASSLQMLKLYTAHTDHVFWPDSIDWSSIDHPPVALLQGCRQVTDAYLVMLAHSKNGLLVTLDNRLVSAIRGTDFSDSVKGL